MTHRSRRKEVTYFAVLLACMVSVFIHVIPLAIRTNEGQEETNAFLPEHRADTNSSRKTIKNKFQSNMAERVKKKSVFPSSNRGIPTSKTQKRSPKAAKKSTTASTMTLGRPSNNTKKNQVKELPQNMQGKSMSPFNPVLPATKAAASTATTRKATTKQSTAIPGNPQQRSDFAAKYKTLIKKKLPSKAFPVQTISYSARNITNTTVQSNNVIPTNVSVVPIGIKHFFWKGRQQRLCKLIRNVTKKEQPILLNLTIRCQSIHDALHVGSGNLVLGFYGMRLAAATGGVDFMFRCTDYSVPSKQLLPWLQGYYSAASFTSPYQPSLPTLKGVAHGMGHCPLQFMSEAIRHDLRAMAVAMVDKGQKSTTDMDDVAIHFRCGDILKGLASHDYGLVQFSAYKQHVSPNARTIGIVTTSFDEKDMRANDKGTTDVCKFLVLGLVQYLEHAFPRAQVFIRNGESMAQSYARMIMANQTFCGPSTFGIFPTIASFGTGYIQDGRVNYFVGPIAKAYEDVHLMQAPLLSSLAMRKMAPREILEWLVRPFCVVNMSQKKLSCGSNNQTVAAIG